VIAFEEPMTDRRNDNDLLVAARTDPAAFEELYRRHVRTTIRFAARRAEHPSEIVDLVAAVWLEVVASIDRFEPSRGDALPWILGIAANLCAVDRRRLAREREATRRLSGQRDIDDLDIDRLERAIEAEAIAPTLRHGLGRLPPAERAVAELVFIDGLTPSEAGAALGVRPAAARMRLARARRRLRSQLGRSIPNGVVEEVLG
jgi:RNA polymerase sigma factor (sigma-70 family)